MSSNRWKKNVNANFDHLKKKKAFLLRGNVLLCVFLPTALKRKKALIWQSNRWSLGSVPSCIHTPYVSSVITFRSLFRAQWQRDWVGRGLTTVSVSHRQAENMQTPSALIETTDPSAIVWLSSLYQFRTQEPCWPEILKEDRSKHLNLGFKCVQPDKNVTCCGYIAKNLFSCMFVLHDINDIYCYALLQLYKQNFLKENSIGELV